MSPQTVPSCLTYGGSAHTSAQLSAASRVHISGSVSPICGQACDVFPISPVVKVFCPNQSLHTLQNDGRRGRWGDLQQALCWLRCAGRGKLRKGMKLRDAACRATDRESHPFFDSSSSFSVTVYFPVNVCHWYRETKSSAFQTSIYPLSHYLYCVLNLTSLFSSTFLFIKRAAWYYYYYYYTQTQLHFNTNLHFPFYTQ